MHGACQSNWGYICLKYGAKWPRTLQLDEGTMRASDPPPQPPEMLPGFSHLKAILY